MDSRRTFIIRAGIGSAAFAFGQPSSPELRSELAKKDLAIGRVTGSVLRILPFDAPFLDRRYPRDRVGPRTSAMPVNYAWGSDCAGVVFLTGDLAKGPSLTVVDKEGQVSWSTRMKISPLAVPSLGPQRRKVAFITRHSSSFRLWHLSADGSPTEITSATIGDNPHAVGSTIGWSPDQTRNVISWNGSIVLCGVETGSSTYISAGDNPNWSPDGHLISFEAVDGHLTVVSSTDFKNVVFRSARKVIGAPSGVWSPDSKYIVCNEQVVSQAGPASNVIVYRIADRASVVLWNNLGINISDCGVIAHWQEWAAALPPLN